MGLQSTIEWTESTWNPVTGCTKVSPGCKHCYAERMAERLKAMGQPNYRNGFRLTLHPHMLDVPLRWRRPQRVFVNSMSDLFHNDVPVEFIQQVFDVMRRAHWHRFQVLTKRADRLRELSHEAILRGTLLIDTTGEQVGQINGLSVLQLGQFAFAQPSRITAATRLGSGVLIDIQREVKLGGSIHSKGVLILSSFLASRYSSERPLSLSASIVFEQTYGPVEGDSASLAELCALLSSLSSLPLRQSLAVTGSVDQFGRVQAIGAVNEKIEGFFDICSKRGLNEKQGVLIPASNVPHLMLRRDVVEAAAAGNFHIYPVETVDQAIELLTGMAAGMADSQGNFPEGSVNRRVADRLKQLAELRRAYGKEEAADKAAPSGEHEGHAGQA